MSATNTIITFIIGFFSVTASAQDSFPNEAIVQTTALTEKKQKLNFFVVSKRKKGKIDPATRFNVLRTKIKSLFRPKNFVAIIAGDAEQASAKIIHRLKK